MRGDEARVERVFADWLRQHGWDVRVQVEHADIVAERDGQRLVAEAKGRTSDAGTDLDTLYGQLLRRMTGDPSTRYAVVVPEGKGLRAALRVSAELRARLRVDVYAVTDDDRVVPQKP